MLKTKIFTCALSSIMLFSAMPATTIFADELTTSDNSIINIENDDDIIDFGTCGENVGWYVDNSSTLCISGSGPMYNYKNSEAVPWSKYKDQINVIILYPLITSIGDYAFREIDGYLSFKNIEATKLSRIGNYALNPNLLLSADATDTVLRLPNTVTSIGNYAFANSKYTAVILPTGLKTIGAHAFDRSINITSITIPNTVTSIGSYAFANMAKLKSVVGGSSLKTIGSYAFANCKQLVTLKITSSKLKTIGAYSFKSDSRLKTLYIQKTTKLTKSSVKKSLKSSSIKTVKVKKSKVKKYKKYFTKKNCGRKVKVKK